MKRYHLVTALAVALLASGALSCRTAEEEGSEPEATAAPSASITILSPGPSEQFDPGQTVSVQLRALDEEGVGSIELWVEGKLADSATVPEGATATEYEAFLFWTADTAGQHAVQVKELDREGSVRSTASQTVTVTDAPMVSRVVQTSSLSRGAPVSRADSSSSTGRKPRIVYFRSDVSQARPGDTITLEWDAPRAVRGFLYARSQGGSYDVPRQVFPKGSISHTIDPLAKGEIVFTLSMLSRTGEQAESTLAVPLLGEEDELLARAKARIAGLDPGPRTTGGCTRDWFFTPAPNECASGSPLRSEGAQQHFQHGVMIWVADLDVIYVLYDDAEGRNWQSFPDEFEVGMPEADPAYKAPDGLQQPIRGFGHLWRSRQAVRDRIGWALDHEVGAPTAVQSTARDANNVIFLMNLYSGTYRLEANGTWSFIEAAGSGGEGASAAGTGEQGDVTEPSPLE